MNLAHADVVILCGGLGTRLRSVSKGCQKTMIEVCGKPFLEIVIDWARDCGLSRFILCTGYQGSQIRDYFTQRRSGGLDIVFAHEESPMGTAGALLNCRNLLRSETFLMLNGDSLCPLSLKSLFQFHSSHSGIATVATVAADSRSDGGYIDMDADGKILTFSEKLPRSGRQLNAGIYLLERDVLNYIPNGKAVSMEKEIFPNLLENGIYAYPCAESLIDIGTPERLESFRRDYTAKTSEVSVS